jgi:hypothetical protein
VLTSKGISTCALCAGAAPRHSRHGWFCSTRRIKPNAAEMKAVEITRNIIKKEAKKVSTTFLQLWDYCLRL